MSRNKLLTISVTVFVVVVFFGVIYFKISVDHEPIRVYLVPERSSTGGETSEVVNRQDTLPAESYTPLYDVGTERESDEQHQLPEQTSRLPLVEEVLTEDFLDSSEESVPDVESEYPKVPAGYPLVPPWKMSNDPQTNFAAGSTNQLTLMHKVLIKLWNQGDQSFVAGVIKESTGKIYPLYPNTLYVRWGEMDLPDGTTRRYIRRTLGPPGLKLTTDQLGNGEIPPGIKVIDMDSGGIDPQLYLRE